MSESGKAVFLSYASEDARAAERICAALRSAGVEVRFDRSELRGGDECDATIRRQIKACSLFLPIISAHTQARGEGCFRLEWKLPPHSIAVLPFVNMSGEPRQDYFSDGLSEELLNSLVTIRDLQVVARTSSSSFKGEDTDLGERAAVPALSRLHGLPTASRAQF